MRKQIIDMTFREVLELCDNQEFCCDCPLFVPNSYDKCAITSNVFCDDYVELEIECGEKPERVIINNGAIINHIDTENINDD